MSDIHIEGPYTDTGTGAYDNPPAETTYESAVSADPTGLVEGPPAEVTTEALEHEGEPTGASPNPPAETTSYGWPAQPPAGDTADDETGDDDDDTKAVSGDEDKVEDKTVRQATKKKGA